VVVVVVVIIMMIMMMMTMITTTTVMTIAKDQTADNCGRMRALIVSSTSPVGRSVDVDDKS